MNFIPDAQASRRPEGAPFFDDVKSSGGLALSLTPALTKSLVSFAQAADSSAEAMRSLDRALQAAGRALSKLDTEDSM